MLTRRTFLSAIALSGCTRGAAPPRAPVDASLLRLERTLGGRVGVFALDTANERSLAHREDERFAMCSTFKWALVALVLAGVDRRELELGQLVSFGQRDLQEYAPITKENVTRGSMTLQALAEAAITVSDNTAANLLLSVVGGPPALTAFFRRVGDATTRLDRNEPMLNTNVRGDSRDTTTPRAMVGSMRAVLTGKVLSASSRAQLVAWMDACATGHERLRAGLPAGWAAGDKTGTGNNGACNDVAIVRPPGRSPLLIASYLSDSSAGASALDAAHVEIARVVANTFAG